MLFVAPRSQLTFAPHCRFWAQDLETAAVGQLCQRSSRVELNHSTGTVSLEGWETTQRKVGTPVLPTVGHASPAFTRLLFSPSAAKCQPIWLTANAVQPLPCPRLSNWASRQWVKGGAALNASFLVLPQGELVLVGSPDQAGHYECWSEEGGFRQLMASYCVRVEPEGPGWLRPLPGPPEIISTSRSTSPVSAAGGIAALLEGNSYWTEFLVMCVLFGLTATLLTLFVLHRHRTTMKAFLKQGRCTNAQAKKLRQAGLPAESLPLNGTSAPSAVPDHRGYQTLDDRHVASTPQRDGPPPPGTAFPESGQQPPSTHESFVEMLAPSQRLRVRLGSEIRDSVV